MSYLVVCGVAHVAAGLTLYSGFGLGTLLLPAFALFFPLEVAVAEVIKDGRVRTYDMGGRNSTLEMGKAIAAAVGETKPVVAGRR